MTTQFKFFKGDAKPIDDIDLPRIGAEIGVGEDELHAFIEAETRGSGFDDEGRPRILFERHKFYKYVPSDKRDAAVKSGLANKSPGGYGKESEQYGKLKRAMEIDEHAALMSCSWGLAQVMGFNHDLAGYETVEEMVLAFMDDEENHLQAAVNFIKASGLDDELRAHNWAKFAKGYNGANYAINKYDQKLATAFAKWSKIRDTPYSTVETAAPEPVSGDVVKYVQQLLRDKGFPEVGNVDGKTGERTVTTIKTFQAYAGLPETGEITDDLIAQLVKYPGRPVSQERAAATAETLKDAPSVKMGDTVRKVGLIGSVASLGGGAIQSVTDLDDLNSKLTSARAVYETVMSFGPWIIGGVLGVVAFIYGSKFIREQVQAYREGRHV